MYRRIQIQRLINTSANNQLKTLKLKYKLKLEQLNESQQFVSPIFSSSISSFSLSGLCNYKGYERNFSSSSSSLRLLALKNHYEILNVNNTATTAEIREAFLKLSKEYHPDLNIGDPEEDHNRFVAINEAYMVLSKPSSRRDYDLTLQVKKHLRQQSNYQAYRSYGYQADAPHYHHRNRTHVDWDGTSSSPQAEDTFRNGTKFGHSMLTSLSLTVIFTFAFVAVLSECSDYIIPSPPRKTAVKRPIDLSEKDFIMTSIHEGQTVVYYAVPDDDNSEVFKVHAFFKREVEGNPNEYVLEELNSA